MTEVNPRAQIGDNNPPTPYETVKAEIDLLYEQASHWLDGAPVDTQALADGVETLEGMIKAAIAKADGIRKAEAKPHDDAKNEIQTRFNLLIGETKSVTGTAVRALAVCKKALTPWKIKVQAEKDAAAYKLRVEAEDAARLAREAHQAANAASDLRAAEEADELLRQSEQAAKAANKAEKSATTKTGLRTIYTAEVTDFTLLARTVWIRDRMALETFLQEWAAGEVRRAGLTVGSLDIPGVTITAHQEAR